MNETKSDDDIILSLADIKTKEHETNIDEITFDIAFDAPEILERNKKRSRYCLSCKVARINVELYRGKISDYTKGELIDIYHEIKNKTDNSLGFKLSMIPSIDGSRDTAKESSVAYITPDKDILYATHNCKNKIKWDYVHRSDFSYLRESIIGNRELYAKCEWNTSVKSGCLKLALIKYVILDSEKKQVPNLTLKAIILTEKFNKRYKKQLDSCLKERIYKFKKNGQGYNFNEINV